MDAVEFLNEVKRYCKNRNCEKCQLNTEKKECGLYNNTSKFDNKSIVLFIEQWSQAHPQKTIMQDFFEKFPNAPKNKNGEPMTCPYNCGYGNFCCEQVSGICYDCWSRPLED